ncbi:hypothetical protein A3D00_03360 [Candidatus Woesebacteria bacterium RIFCSPHIGHO2_02_FULL_38_9]|uniref:Uncharacterized protein n=1 Tax=Candidatus Woesebacteria bacterium RIFCSPHIGHO2_01_FULL_39_28 TaxID=1802496 RepID=A0A1F7YEI9_9BACT|nr:MAG: hypothetical protein A2627_01565 [Candidatus Woesebacteria bacterium RIFCSPHIGHO2_01_FULL_39_28]OGM32273.1 MAG: hypothetical protein A3D00_03360 [Candidatus Woesebacteria bacterium RIFCSPHIGHO2_02_FULL_38_9]OGM56874.1 MAG: hypothetical protein A3A50_03950 [Candidatus Woesebacteria bacterium RIFCSPLOWO2_01_FULL_38_20]
MKYKLKTKHKSLKKYKDIRFINEWPNRILVKRYDEVKQAAIKLESKLEKLGLYEQEEKDKLAEEYRRTLKLIEFLEDKGRQRNILYFMPWEKVVEICKRIFNDKRKFKLVSKGYTPQA